ncbi:hypothetical protein [Streptomyces sp. NPDC048248]|uniref:hypothetical protein n=1 Tax=Streptomyces sp. NPDC048248 TaxID=3365523 RepID=UPI00371B04B6
MIGLRTEIHEGIPDEDHVTALKVLRRMTDNIARPNPATSNGDCRPAPPPGTGRAEADTTAEAE